MKRRGVFFTFEGGEGVGKSTQIRMLARALKKQKIPFVLTREPGGTATGERLRKILKSGSLHLRTELLILEAARAEHVERVIRPALAAGKVVLCDRFTDSSLVYQGLVRGLPLSLVEAANRLATGGLQPDRTILLDHASEKIIKTRVMSRKRKFWFDREAMSFHLKVQRAYRMLAKKNRRIHIFHSNQSKLELHQEILKNIQRLLKKAGHGSNF